MSHYLPRVIFFIFKVTGLSPVGPALHLTALMLREVKFQYHVAQSLDRPFDIGVHRTDLCGPLRLPSPLGPLDG